MTREQKYHRRLARKFGESALIHAAAADRVYSDWKEYRGMFSAYYYAKQAAWHAFKAHPELREVTA